MFQRHTGLKSFAAKTPTKVTQDKVADGLKTERNLPSARS